MRSRTRSALLVALALGATAIAACGEDEEDGAAPPPPAATQPAQTETADREQTAATVDVAADPGGELAFVQDSLTAPAGPVTFAFTNRSSVPHDFNIEQDGERIDGTKVITEAEESLDVELEPGRYTYYCSVGNHREAGMEGRLIVE